MDRIKQRSKAIKLLDEVRDMIIELEEYSESLRKANEELQSDHYKDNALSDMKHKLEENKNDIGRGFPITKNEAEALEKWKDNHIKIKHNASSSGKWNFIYEFYPASVGTFGTCRCLSCMNKVKMETGVNDTPFKTRELIEKYDAEFEFKRANVNDG